jgi:CheY-like chemotaxis protein
VETIRVPVYKEGKVAFVVTIMRNAGEKEIVPTLGKTATGDSGTESARTLARRIAHDFNDLFSVIGGNVSLALADMEPGSRTHRLLSDVQKAVAMGRNVIRKLMVISEGREATEQPEGLLPDEEVTDAEAPKREPKKILLLDDEPMVLHMTALLLNHLGYEVTCSENGKEAIELYQKDSHDAVILDLTVKEGGGALETIKDLLAINPETRAILSTGYTDDPAVVDFAKHGFKGVITKPYEIGRLAKILEKVLNDTI